MTLLNAQIKETKSALDFFLLQQQRINLVKEKSELFSLETLREEALKYVDARKHKPNLAFLLDELHREEHLPAAIPHSILDDAFAAFLDVNCAENHQNENIIAFFTSLAEPFSPSPLQKDLSFFIHSGFFSQEADIYRSVIQGFQGILLFAQGKDFHELQLLTEIGRDFHITTLFVASTLEEVNEILKTDAPYLVISALNPKNFKLDLSLALRAPHQVPKTCRLFCLAPKISALERKSLQGYHGIISTSF